MDTDRSFDTSFNVHEEGAAEPDVGFADGPPRQPSGYGDQPGGGATDDTPIKIGARVTAIVTGIAEYGVFVTTPDGQRGLIHISEISDWFVEDARDYFLIGEELLVEVVSREEGTGKYAFSTRRLGGKQPVGDGYTRRLMSYQPTGERPAGHGVSAPRRSRLSPPPRRQTREHEEITTFLRNRVGEVSEEAGKLLVHLVAQYGPVRVALALADVTRRFDRSLALVNWVARSLEQGEPNVVQESQAQP